MGKPKYKFNPETLQFEKIELTLKQWFVQNICTRFGISLLSGIVIFIAASFYIDSPKERKLIEARQHYLLKYDLLNKRLRGIEVNLDKLQIRDDEVYRPIYEADPIPATIRKAGIGGVNKYSNMQGYSSSELVVNTLMRMDKVSKQTYIQSKSYDEIYTLAKNKERMLASIPAIQPVSNKDLTAFGPFGMRFHPILHYTRMHNGVDLCAAAGTKIYAAGDGRVSKTDYNGGLGYYVKINHGFGYETVYGHLLKMLVKPGQKVKRGDVIALMGTTGLSNTNHLHYEVHYRGAPVNPINYYGNDLTSEEYEKMIKVLTNKTLSDFD